MIYEYECPKCDSRRSTDSKDGQKPCECGAKMELVLMYGYNDVYDTNDPKSMKKKIMPPVYKNFKEDKPEEKKEVQ